MANLLLDYMNKRSEGHENIENPHGPVITISRDYGCFATEIAQRVSELILQQSKKKWRFITKEILEESAKELNVNTHEIAHMFGADEKSFLGDLIVSFSKKKYTSDSTIKKAISSVVNNYASRGNSIIVGRAGCIIAKDIKKSLHVKITAPFEYRVNATQERYKITTIEAELKVATTDEKRKRFMSFFKADIPENELFHIVLNKSMLTNEEIAEAIVSLAKQKELF